MKIYIKADSNPTVDPIKMLNYLLGFDSYNSIVEKRTGEHYNFALVDHMYRLTDNFINKYKPMLKAIGAKYINPNRSLGVMYFYIDENKLAVQYTEAKEAARKAKQEADDKLMEHLRTVNIEQYKPTDAVIKKLKDYRDRGSKVNVKAIKDENKLLTYCYSGHLLGWGELVNACEMENSFGWRWNDDHRDVFKAMNRLILRDPQYADTRTEFEQKYDLPDSKGLFTFEDKHCWVPKKILMYFIENNIPVHFGKRTSGAEWDRNGRQWSEVEHLIIFPDSDHPINYDLVVHTDEGGGANTYTGNGTDERTSIKNVIEDIDRKVRRYQV